MADLDRGAILARTKRKVKAVETDDGTVHVRSLTVGEKDAFDDENMTVKDGKAVPNVRTYSARLAALTLCDRDGNRLFNDLDAAQLQHLDAPFLEPAVTAARRLNGMLPPTEEERGNSSPAPDAASA